MTRAPFVMAKAETAFSRAAKIEDTTLGWRFVNKLMKAKHGIDFDAGDGRERRRGISNRAPRPGRLRLPQPTPAAQAIEDGRLESEIAPVMVPKRKGDPVTVARDEHPRPETTLEGLAKLPTPFRQGGTVTAGNASGVNDGACALLVASEEGARRHGLTPRARVVAMASAGVAPRIMGVGPAPASRKVLANAGLDLDRMDVIELNEAFAAQVLAVTRELRLPDDAEHMNPNGGAIAFGHPLGMSGARLVLTAVREFGAPGRPLRALYHVHRRRPGHRHDPGAGVTPPM